MDKIAGKASSNAKAIDRQAGRLSKQYVDFSRKSSDQEQPGRLEPDSDDTSSGNEDIEKGIKVGQYQGSKKKRSAEEKRILDAGYRPLDAYGCYKY